MVAISMSSMLLKVIGKETCLRVKSLWAIKGSWTLNLITWTKDELKEIKDSIKVENGGVHHKKYDGRYMKQWVKIQNAT
jgi:hypothetical protein